MTLQEYTLDLTDAPADLVEQIEQTEQAEDTLLEKVDEKYPEDGFHDPECPDSYEDKFYEIREQRGELQSRKARIEKFLEGADDDPQASDWSHYEFTFREPSTEDALFIQGRSEALAEEAAQRGKQIAGQMFGVTEMLDRLRIDAPSEAPADLASDLPSHVGRWLLNTLNSKTTEGIDEDLGNTSPQEALKSYKNSPQSSTTDQGDPPEKSH